MNLLQFFFITSWIIILILAIDIAKRQKFNAIHFLVFIWVWIWLLVFTFFPNVLNFIWSIFGLQRWADVLVYSSIIFLLYFNILLLTKVESNKSDITMLLRELSIINSPKKIIEWELVFLVRVFNEEPVLKNTIENILNNWYKNILVINDWSTDNSIKILNDFWDKIILINHIKNRWAWAALETGFEYLRRYSKTKYVCTFDSDWQHDIKDINLFIDMFNKNKDLKVIFWSRFITKTNTNISLIRKIVLKLWIIFTFFISNIKLTDAHNWYRVFKTDVLKDLKLTIDDMSYASEIIDLVSLKKINFWEVPVNIIYTEYSKSKWQSSFNAINIALTMILKKIIK